MSNKAMQQPQAESGPPGSGGWEKHALEMERQRDHYRQRCDTMYEHQRGDVWYWQGNGEDSLESMGNAMLVVIRADQLRELMLSKQPQAVPAIYVSRGQLENLKPDPDDEAGTYLPVRKTPKGKFTHPLFAAPQQAEVQTSSQPLDELQKDASDLLFALHDAWPYVHAHCTIKSKRDAIQRLIVKHGDFAEFWKDKQPQAAHRMADRLMGWKLPADFNPDGGIWFDRDGKNHGGYPHEWPTGTNLLTHEQAKAMFEYVLEGVL